MAGKKAAEEPAAEPVKKKSKLRMIIMALLVIGVVGGAGAGAGVYFLGGSEHAGAHEPERPKLVPREDADEGEVAAAMRSGRRPDPRLFKASYVALEDNFTVNLAGSGAYVQIGIALSTFYDERVVTAIETHKVAIRSTILMTLANQDPVTVNTPAGRLALQRSLRDAINHSLEQREGFGGIDEVHFTSFVTQ